VRVTYSIVIWTLALLLFLSLVTYDPNDVMYNTTHPNSPPNNAVGIMGAWMGFGCLFAIGFSSYLVLGILVYLGCEIVRRKEPGSTKELVIRSAAAALMLLAASCLLDLPLIPRSLEEARRLNIVGPGGIAGNVLSMSYLLPCVGFTGSVIICAAVLATSLLVFTRFMAFYFVGFLAGKAFTAASHSVKFSADVIAHRHRVVPLSIRKVRVRQFERSFRHPGKVKITVAPRREEQGELVTPAIEQRVAPVVAKERAAPQALMPRFRRARSGGTYKLPGTDLLHDAVALKGKQIEEDLQRNVEILQGTLKEFGIEAEVGNVIRGPVITSYEVHPAPGVKVQKITTLADDLALAMAASSIRIVAPIPGKSAVGIEIPNAKTTLVTLKEMLLAKEFRQTPMHIPLAIGKEISGHPVFADLREMPHLLIAGATGSGKTVCINSMILSMLFSCTPDELKLILKDPKRVEMTQYRHIPHLLTPVVTESKAVAQALRWSVREMEKRYKLFSGEIVRDILGYNTKLKQRGGEMLDEEGEPAEALPFIVIIIDELADLMLVARKDIEDPIIRLAQMGRAAGLHIILATQRPSVNVITGLIKANFPTRIAFKVASKVDSKVILDTMGADKLIGRGDMLFVPPGASRRLRVQGTLVEDDEIDAVVGFVKAVASPEYREDILSPEEGEGDLSYEDIDDDLYEEAVGVVRQLGQASASLLQRRMRIGYARAARLVDMMEERGVVGPQQGSKAREVF
jgi:S-DNA-T family DNA segregation ATPase FtsK/SpoIIIE